MSASHVAFGIPSGEIDGLDEDRIPSPPLSAACPKSIHEEYIRSQ